MGLATIDLPWINEQKRVYAILSRISQALGVPVGDFREDALAWCCSQVNSTEWSLYNALSHIEKGDSPPWAMNDKAQARTVPPMPKPDVMQIKTW